MLRPTCRGGSPGRVAQPSGGRLTFVQLWNLIPADFVFNVVPCPSFQCSMY